MSKPWDFWTEWDQNKCYQRYVYGDRISLNELSRISGVPFKSVAGWSTLDNWVRDRESFQADLKIQIRQKTLDKSSEETATHLASLAEEHQKAYSVSRKVAEIYFNHIYAECERKKHPEMIEEYLKEISPVSLNLFSMVLDRAIKGERTATSMDYEDVNVAYKALESAGYKIVANGLEKIDKGDVEVEYSEVE